MTFSFFDWESFSTYYRLASVGWTWFMAFFVLLSNPRKKLNMLFFGSSFLVGMWSFLDFLQVLMYPVFQNSYLYDLSLLSGTTSVFFYCALFHKFPKPEIRFSRWAFYSLLLMCCVIVYAIFTKSMYFNWGTNIPLYPYEPTVLGLIQVNFCSVIFIWALLLILYKFWRIEAKQDRAHCLIVGTGLLITYYILYVFNLSPSSFTQTKFAYDLGYTSFNFLYLAFYLSIAMDEAFEIRTVLHQRLLWMFSSSFILIPLIWVLANLDFHILVGQEWHFFLKIQTLFFLTMIYIFKIQPLIDQFFFRRRVKLNAVLVELQMGLSAMQTLEDLVRRVLLMVSKAIYPKKVSLFLATETEELLVYDFQSSGDRFKKGYFLTKPNESMMYFPIFSESVELGAIGVSEKKNLKAYSAAELFFLNKLGRILGQYFESSILYERLLKEQEMLLLTGDQLTVQETDKQHRIEKKELYRQMSLFISHEIKNIVYGVSGMIETLKFYPQLLHESQKREKVMATLVKQCDRVQEWSDSYLSIDRISKGQVSYEFFNLSQLLEDVCENFSLLASKRKQQLVVDLTPELTIESDPKKLRLILDNLIRNAISYGTESFPVSISASLIDERKFQIQVSNHGGPIPSKLGLGLLLVKVTCDELNLDIKIDSTEQSTSINILSK